jgi:hypothetical protein
MEDQMFHFKMVWIDKDEKEFTNYYARQSPSEHEARLQLVRSTFRTKGRVKSLVICSAEEFNKYSKEKSEAIKPKKEVTPSKKSIKAKKKKD